MQMLRKWAADNDHIESIIIVGSYARGTSHAASDLDLVIITSEKAALTEHQDFTGYFGSVLKKQTEYYGACTSVRVWYKSGMEVEFGLVSPSWISLPLDSGTCKVLSGGYLVVADKKGHFLKLGWQRF